MHGCCWGERGQLHRGHTYRLIKRRGHTYRLSNHQYAYRKKPETLDFIPIRDIRELRIPYIEPHLSSETEEPEQVSQEHFLSNSVNRGISSSHNASDIHTIDTQSNKLHDEASVHDFHVDNVVFDNVFINEHTYSTPDKSLSIKLLCINVCGLLSKLRYPDFEEFCQSYDIVCIVESKLSSLDSFEINNFKNIAFTQPQSSQI